jgi:hypothetical protein
MGTGNYAQNFLGQKMAKILRFCCKFQRPFAIIQQKYRTTKGNCKIIITYTYYQKNMPLISFIEGSARDPDYQRGILFEGRKNSRTIELGQIRIFKKYWYILIGVKMS